MPQVPQRDTVFIFRLDLVHTLYAAGEVEAVRLQVASALKLFRL